MPQYTVTDPTTKKTVTLTGDSPPSEAELTDIFAKVNGETTPAPAAPTTEPNSVGNFASHVGAQINPKAAIESLSQAVQHPIQTVQNIGAAQGQLFEKAKASYEAGDHVTAARHFVDYLLPLVGPVLDKAADHAQQGEYTASAGDAVGLGLSMFGPKGLANGVEAMRGTAPAQAVGKAAQEGATQRAVEVMAPTIGPNKVRFGNQAAKVAPEILRKTTARTKGGLQNEVATHLDTAHGMLDAAYDAVPDTKMYATAPIILKLQQAVKDLSVSGIGGSVEPSTRASRIGALRQAIEEVKQAGSVMNADNLRKLRIAWDEGAKAVFTPAIAPDALKVKGAGAGWADARSALNDYIIDKHPELKPLNADVSLWTRARDVMQAAEEADRVRPKVGRTIMARGLGAMAGGREAGGLGVVVGTFLGPLIESGFSALAPTRKLIMARQLQSLSDAIRSGNATRAKAIVSGLEKALPAGPALRLVPTAGSGLPAAAQERQQPTR